MSNDSRFELKLSRARRAELDLVAERAGVSASDLARLAITRLLDERSITLPGAEKEAAA